MPPRGYNRLGYLLARSPIPVNDGVEGAMANVPEPYLEACRHIIGGEPEEITPILNTKGRIVGLRLRRGYEVVTILNGSTETRWFTTAVEGATAVCFLRGRFSFQGHVPTQGQWAVYQGANTSLFVEAFGRFGLGRAWRPAPHNDGKEQPA